MQYTWKWARMLIVLILIAIPIGCTTGVRTSDELLGVTDLDAAYQHARKQDPPASYAAKKEAEKSPGDYLDMAFSVFDTPETAEQKEASEQFQLAVPCIMALPPPATISSTILTCCRHISG